MTMMQKLERWAYGALSGAISGGGTSASTWLGMAGAKALGVDVPSLNFKALGVIFLSGAAVNFFLYLKTTPLPPISNGDTAHLTKADVATTPSDKPLNPT